MKSDSNMSSLEDEEQTIHVSRRQLSALETKANAATDFIQHFQNIDKELKKEKAKVKKFTKMLIDGHRVIERLTSVRCSSVGELSTVDSRSLMQSIIEIDGSSGGPSICFPFGDEIPSPEPFPCTDVTGKHLIPRAGRTSSGSSGHSPATLRVSRSDSTTSTSLRHISLPYNRSASINNSVGKSKSSNDAFNEVVDEKGVSESVFLNLVRELKRTKYCLNQLMLEKGLTLEEFMKGKIDKATLEDMAANIEDLRKENENYQNKISELNNSLSFYKRLVRDDREGLTSDTQSTGVKSKSLDALKSEEDLNGLKIQNSQLKNQLMTMEEEKNMILDNYAKCIQAINELEHNLNEDQLKKQSDLLKKEVEKLQREIKNLQNDNEKLVSSVSHHSQYREKYKEEHAKLVKTEAELKEDKSKVQRMETEINLLKAKVKHLYKQIDPEKAKAQKTDKIQAPVKPTKKQSLPVESTSTVLGSDCFAHTSLTGVKAKNIMSSYECERCQAQFEDEMEHLRHINKCLD